MNLKFDTHPMIMESSAPPMHATLYNGHDLKKKNTLRAPQNITSFDCTISIFPTKTFLTNYIYYPNL